jgi:hypothetical protein
MFLNTSLCVHFLVIPWRIYEGNARERTRSRELTVIYTRRDGRFLGIQLG